MELADTASPETLPSVSVVVPCYRLGDDTAERLVNALARQDHSAELIFVDDGSGDGTDRRLRARVAGLSNARVLVHAENRGRAAARNTGIEAASGDVVLFLDADMVPADDFVRAHAEAHRDPGVMGVLSTPRLCGIDPANIYHRYLQRQHRATVRGDGPVPFRTFIIGYTSVKAVAVEAVDGFDERFTYGEDIDFAYRLSRVHPGGLIRSSQAVVDHYGHGDLDERLAKLREFGRHNLPLLLSKHPDLAESANLDFARPLTLRGRLRQAALRAIPRLALLRVVARIPQPARHVAMRYLMASTVADAYRHAPTEHIDL